MTTISACIVAKNAAALLPECIASVRDEVDEVLLVDNGSSDETRAVAESAGARIVDSSEPNHERARNAYIEAARTEWLLVIDADERFVAGPARPRLRQVVSSTSAHGLSLERFDWLGGGRWATNPHLRLFRRADHVRYFASSVHASVAPSIRGAGGAIARSGLALNHVDALLSRDHAAKRANFRARLEVELARPAPPAILRCFYALELSALGDEAASDAQLDLALKSDARIEPIASLFRAQQHRASGRFDEAARLARHALDLPSVLFGGRDSAYALLADAEDRLGRLNDAVATTRAAIAESPLVASHHLNLALLLGAAGADSRSHLSTAVALNPWIDSPRVLGAGARPSIFVQQDAVLGRYRP